MDPQQKKSLFQRFKPKIFREAKSIYGLLNIHEIDEDHSEETKKLKKSRMLNCVGSQIEKVMIRNKLGPGKYAPTSPNLLISHSFSSLPRFSNTPEEKFAIRRNKSPSHISILSRIPSQYKVKPMISMNRKRSAKEFQIKIAKETKRIIQHDVSVRKLRNLGLKHEKIIAKVKPSTSSLMWAKILCFFTVFQVFKELMSLKVAEKQKTLPKRSKSALI